MFFQIQTEIIQPIEIEIQFKNLSTHPPTKNRKQTNKTNLNYLKFVAFLMQRNHFDEHNFNFEGSNSSQLTRKCF